MRPDTQRSTARPVWPNVQPTRSTASASGMPPRGASTSDVLRVGDLVTVYGLKGALQHNGKQGVVQEFNSAKARFVVKLGDEKLLAIKPENLYQTHTAQPRRAEPPPPSPSIASLLEERDGMEEVVETRLGPPTRDTSMRRLVRQRGAPTESELETLAGFYSPSELANALQCEHHALSYPSLPGCSPTKRSASVPPCAACNCPFGKLRAQDLSGSRNSERFNAALSHLVEIEKVRALTNSLYPVRNTAGLDNARNDDIHVAIARKCRSLNPRWSKRPAVQLDACTTRYAGVGIKAPIRKRSRTRPERTRAASRSVPLL